MILTFQPKQKKAFVFSLFSRIPILLHLLSIIINLQHSSVDFEVSVSVSGGVIGTRIWKEFSDFRI